MKSHPNAQHSSKTPGDAAYRAEVAADGSVALIADTEGLGIRLTSPGQQMTTVQLSADDFEKLHKKLAPEDKGLFFDFGKRTFHAKKIR